MECPLGVLNSPGSGGSLKKNGWIISILGGGLDIRTSISPQAPYHSWYLAVVALAVTLVDRHRSRDYYGLLGRKHRPVGKIFLLAFMLCL